MIPGRRLLWLIGILFAVLFVAAVWPAIDVLGRPLAVVLLAATVFDALRLWVEPVPWLRRQVAHNLPQGRARDVVLRLRNACARSLALTVYDHHPASFLTADLPLHLTLGPGQNAVVAYTVRPTVRGPARFAATDLLISSSWQLWQRRYRARQPDDVKVYPDFGEIADFALLATRDHLGALGVRRQRRRGEGNDFHQLRDYQRGDSLRQVDWKASSRYRRLISREYQEESDQRILFVLDCGRHMRHAADGRAHLDQALNAVLLLAYVAARQGDAVGLLTFAGEDRFVPPQKGYAVVTSLLRQVYDLQPTHAAPDYLRVAERVMASQPRRSLIVLLTNTRGEDADDLLAGLRLLYRRHLVLIADLREADIDHGLRAPVRDLPSALRFQMLQKYLERRRRGQEHFRQHGAHIVESTPAELPIRLVNEYLAIKESGVL